MSIDAFSTPGEANAEIARLETALAHLVDKLSWARAGLQGMINGMESAGNTPKSLTILREAFNRSDPSDLTKG
jgi:hypothetical protein